MPREPGASDRSLLESCAAGEAAAADLLLRRHDASLRHFLLRRLRDRDLAEEAFQETCVRLFGSAGRLASHPRPEAWLFSVARNVAADILRRRSRDGLSSDPGTSPGGGAVAPEGVRPEAILRSRELSGLVLRAIRDLPPAERQVFLLRTQSLRSFREISVEVGAPLNTVLSRMHRALKRIRGLLADEGWVDAPRRGRAGRDP